MEDHVEEKRGKTPGGGRRSRTGGGRGREEERERLNSPYSKLAVGGKKGERVGRKKNKKGKGGRGERKKKGKGVKRKREGMSCSLFCLFVYCGQRGKESFRGGGEEGRRGKERKRRARSWLRSPCILNSLSGNLE